MLTYDDAAHVYRLDGRRIPSVTQSLKLAGLIDDRWFTPESAARGTAVHAACELVDGVAATRRLVGMASGGGALVEGYVEAYSAFLHDCRPVYAGIEVLCAHPDGTYGGRPDRLVADMFGEAGVLEIKSSAQEEDWHAIQCALYQLMRPMGSRFVVYLQANGRYKLRRAFSADDYRIGRNAVAQAWQVLEPGGILTD